MICNLESRVSVHPKTPTTAPRPQRRSGQLKVLAIYRVPAAGSTCWQCYAAAARRLSSRRPAPGTRLCCRRRPCLGGGEARKVVSQRAVQSVFFPVFCSSAAADLLLGNRLGAGGRQRLGGWAAAGCTCACGNQQATMTPRQLHHAFTAASCLPDAGVLSAVAAPLSRAPSDSGVLFGLMRVPSKTKRTELASIDFLVQ